jgi:hypothetical protein
MQPMSTVFVTDDVFYNSPCKMFRRPLSH